MGIKTLQNKFKPKLSYLWVHDHCNLFTLGTLEIILGNIKRDHDKLDNTYIKQNWGLWFD